MIAEILSSNYDIAGKSVSEKTIEHQPLFHRTFPMRRYVSHPLSVKCTNLKEMREFLSKCKYVSDQKQFKVKDYWMPPDEFEKRKKGDCEDFAFWT